MLAWRAISRRPAAITRQGLHIPRRALSVSLPRTQFQQSRENSLYARIRFRQDGKPRSRLIGAVFGLFFLIDVLLCGVLYGLNEYTKQQLGRIARVVYVLRVDIDFRDVNLDDPVATFIYFKKLLEAFTESSTGKSSEPIETFFKIVFPLTQQSDTESQIHVITRATVEKIHQALEKLERNTIGETLNYMSAVMLEAVIGLIRLVPVGEGDDDWKKDGGTSTREYEPLG